MGVKKRDENVMSKFVLKLSKEDIGTLLLGGEVNVNYELSNVTVKLNEHTSISELEGEKDDQN